MAIETSCQGCGKVLRVGDEHAGRLARCPHCQTIYTVPAPAFGGGGGYPAAGYSSFPAPVYGPSTFSATSTIPAKPDGRWTLKTADGLTFGPVPRTDLDRWLTEGRITPQSQLQQEGSSQWLWAGQIYPQIQSFAADSPFAAGYTQSMNPYAPPSAGAYSWPMGGYRYREQHRGGAILTMSIVGILLCQFISIAAFIMAIIDLGKMSKGTMDPSGRGLTIAGLVISSISLLLFVVMILVNVASL